MTLSATALETAAKAVFEQSIYHGYNDEVKAREWTRTSDLHRNAATAAITAYLAQAGKEGWVMVPRILSNAEVNLALGRDADAYLTPMHSMFRDFHNNVVRAAAAQNGEDLPAPPMGK